MTGPTALSRTSKPDAARVGAFSYVADFTSVRAGTSTAETIRIEANSDFVVQSIQCSANLDAATTVRSRSNLIGTTATGTVTDGVGGSPVDTFESVDVQNLVKLYRPGQVNPATVAGPGLHLIRLMFQVNQALWASSPMRADLISGEAGAALFLPSQPLVPANSQLTVTVYNDMPTQTAAGLGGNRNIFRGISGDPSFATTAPQIGVNLQVLLVGYKVYRG